MAETYNSIQQHQPLRVPARWDKQEKALIIQLGEILDDLYRRFGRLGMKDMSKKFRLTIDGKYNVVSGIEITEEGIDVSGAKYVNIHSGGTFDVDSDNFKINSAERYFTAGAWKFYDYGVDFDNHDFIIGPGAMMVDVPTARYAKLGPMVYDITEEGLSISTYGDRYVVYLGSKLHSLPSNTCFVFRPDRKSSDQVFMIGDSSNHWDSAHIDTVYQASSRLLKHDIKPIAPVGEKLDKLWPVSFVYNKDKTETVHQGLIYEDTVGILPEICQEENGGKSINYLELVPILLKEIQDLRKRVAMLEGKRDV